MFFSMKMYFLDNSLFSFHNNEKFDGIICINVGDSLGAGAGVHENYV